MPEIFILIRVKVGTTALFSVGRCAEDFPDGQVWGLRYHSVIVTLWVIQVCLCWSFEGFNKVLCDC